jgi:uncharacterized protein YbjT (DUF2867 family)
LNILIVGASKGTGALAVKEALSRGYAVTAFARHPEQLGIEHPKLKKLAGDFHAPDSVKAAIKGHDAVIVTASATSLATFKDMPRFFSEGTRHVIDGMKAAGVRRLVILSALGTLESRKLLPFLLQKIMIDWLLKFPFADHERQETMVAASGLDWVVARPGRLTDGPAQRRYAKEAKLVKVPRAIARADVADFLVEAATTEAWLGKSVHI